MVSTPNRKAAHGRWAVLFAFALTIAIFAIYAIVGKSPAASAGNTPLLTPTPSGTRPTATYTHTPSTPTNTPTVTPTCSITTANVSINNYFFSPQSVTIYAGSTVLWTNASGPAPHSATSNTGVWDSGWLGQGQTFSFVFNNPGSYPYHCNVHPSMTGTINVLPGCAFTPTPTATSTPSAPTQLVGHVTWQGPLAQPHARQQLPITLTLKLGTAEYNYTGYTTDPSGFFTVTLSGLPTGTYAWRAKGPRYLANAGALVLSASPLTSVEMGMMRAGDANNDNLAGSVDFNILRSAFGGSTDLRPDWNNDGLVSSLDFNLLRNNFGTSGAPPIGPIGP